MIAPAGAASSTARRPLRARASLRAFLFFALLPNLVLGTCESILRGTATIVNLEFLAIALAALMMGPALTIAAIVIAITADALTVVAPVFHFELAAVVPSLGELAAAQPLTFAVVAMGILLAIVGYALLVIRAAPTESLRDWRIRSAFAAGIVVMIAADATNGSGNAIATRRAFFPVNIAGAPTLEIALAMTQSLRERGLANQRVVPVASATGSLFAGSAQGADAVDVGVVIVESLGQFRDQREDSALFAILSDSAISARYVVRRGTVPYDGPTTAGEFRELCGQRRTYLTAPREPLATCLPARFRKLGYKTVALHGFRREMFDRKRWYPLIGFDSIIDDAVIRQRGPVRECGTVFRGPCDAAVGEIFSQLLSPHSSQPMFVYWLTLSAHFPLDERAAEGATFDCGIWSDLAADNSACQLARTWSRDLALVRAAALDRRPRPTRFVVVGDHAPPLPRGRLDAIFAKGVVPYIELDPRLPLAAATPRGTSPR